MNERIKAVLDEHRESPAAILSTYFGPSLHWSECASKRCHWKSPSTDRHHRTSRPADEHRAHVAEQIAALLPEVTETVEWGVRVTSGDQDYVFPLDGKVLRARDGKRMVARSPETCTIVTRTVRHLADEVSEWVEVQP